MRILIMCSLIGVLVVWGMGCGKSQDELVSFASQISQLKGYNETLARYLHLVETSPEHPGEATQTGKVLDEYYAAMSKIPRPRNITLKALYGEYIRAIEKAQTQLKPPGDPMFALEARRAIRGLQTKVEHVYKVLGEKLQEKNLGGQYALKWPTPGE